MKHLITLMDNLSHVIDPDTVVSRVDDEYIIPLMGMGDVYSVMCKVQDTCRFVVNEKEGVHEPIVNVQLERNLNWQQDRYPKAKYQMSIRWMIREPEELKDVGTEIRSMPYVEFRTLVEIAAKRLKIQG